MIRNHGKYQYFKSWSAPNPNPDSEPQDHWFNRLSRRGEIATVLGALVLFLLALGIVGYIEGSS